ncbi:hypothetical protein WUBG_15781, partial [Wuchereria bancrofti]
MFAQFHSRLPTPALALKSPRIMIFVTFRAKVSVEYYDFALQNHPKADMLKRMASRLLCNGRRRK